MTSVWVLIVVGLGSGVLGTVISTMLRLSHERQAELRSRMLQAADDFALEALRAHIAVERAVELRYEEPEEGGEENLDLPDWPEPADYWSAETLEALERAKALREAVGERTERVKLLWGDDAPAATEAEAVGSEIGAILNGIEGIPRDIYALAHGLLLEVHKHRREFNFAARADLGRRSSRSLRRRWISRRDHARWRRNFSRFAEDQVEMYTRRDE